MQSEKINFFNFYFMYYIYLFYFFLLRTTNNNTSLGDLCLQVSEPIDKLASFVLPHYSCLVLSPSSIWKNNIYR